MIRHVPLAWPSGLAFGRARLAAARRGAEEGLASAAENLQDPVGLLKGFEIELLLGRDDGEVVPLSHVLAPRLDGFMLEPDARTIEYATPPLSEWRDLLPALLAPRQRLRQALREAGNYAVIPGSTIPGRGGSAGFFRADPANAYHDRIERTYGPRVVTTSVHMNFGLPDPEDVIRAYRLMRMDAACVLAFSASSPFFEGRPTGAHSTRWEIFPETPRYVPLFADHADYATWMHMEMEDGEMWNVRHLWASARPNGPDRPRRIDRVELRVADLIMDPLALLGLARLLEHRLVRLLEGRLEDPLACRHRTPAEMVALSRENERRAAWQSLDARLVDWRTGESVVARDCLRGWLDELRTGEVTPLERRLLAAVEGVLEGGNPAMTWIRRHGQGLTPEQVVREAMVVQAATDEARLREFGSPLVDS